MLVISIRSYSVMYKCWKFFPDERPAFDALSSSFMERLQAVAGYLELTMSLEANEGRKVWVAEFLVGKCL